MYADRKAVNAGLKVRRVQPRSWRVQIRPGLRIVVGAVGYVWEKVCKWIFMDVAHRILRMVGFALDWESLI